MTLDFLLDMGKRCNIDAQSFMIRFTDGLNLHDYFNYLTSGHMYVMSSRAVKDYSPVFLFGYHPTIRQISNIEQSVSSPIET